jgi:hypothetical protein
VALAAHDLDGDADLDIVGRTLEGTPSIHLNDGRGAFPGPIELPLQECPFYQAGAAKIDDGPTADLILLHPSCGEVSILRGTAPGVPTERDTNRNGVPDGCEEDCDRNGFPDDLDISSGRSPDCNRNGIPDSCDAAPALGFDEAVCVLDKGDLYTRAIYAADLTGDAEQDLVLAVRSPVDVDPRPEAHILGGKLVLLFNAGKGDFASPQDLDFGPFPHSVAMLDLDLDGDTDLAVQFPTQVRNCRSDPGASPFQRELLLLRNSGRGLFVEGESICNGEHATKVQAADMNADGLVDLVYETGVNEVVSAHVLLNQLPGGTFADPVEVPVGWGVRITDLNQDGFPDLAANARGDGVSVSFNEAAGSFSTPQAVAAGRLHGIADLDEDGDSDLAVVSLRTLGMSLLLNRGDQTFDEVASGIASVSAWLGDSVFSDLDGDEDVDLASATLSGLAVYLNEGNALYGEPLYLRVPAAFPVIATDLDGDSDADLVLGNCRDKLISLLVNATRRPSSADIDRNGIPDECDRRGLQVPGDATQDASLNISDPIHLLSHLFLGAGTRLPCEGGTAAEPGRGELSLLDANADRAVDLADAVVILGHLFLGRPAHALGTECVPIQGCPEVCGN